MNHIFALSARRDYTLTRFRGYLGPLMAEYVVGQIIAQERHFLRFAAHQRAGRWDPLKAEPYRPLSALTLAVLGGLGDIGQSIARAAKAFGMRVDVLGRAARPARGDVVADRIVFADAPGALEGRQYCGTSQYSMAMYCSPPSLKHSW